MTAETKNRTTPQSILKLARRTRVFALVIALGFMLVPQTGCHLYNFGNQSLYRPDIRTINVSIFESDSFRPYLGQRLTESVAKQISLNTTYAIAPPSSADSFVRGRILQDTKRVLTETVNDDPRDIQFGIQIEVTWTDRNGMPLMERQVLTITDVDHFVPEGGQSMTTVQQDIIERIARQIVQQMEMPW